MSNYCNDTTQHSNGVVIDIVTDVLLAKFSRVRGHSSVKSPNGNLTARCPNTVVESFPNRLTIRQRSDISSAVIMPDACFRTPRRSARHRKSRVRHYEIILAPFSYNWIYNLPVATRHKRKDRNIIIKNCTVSTGRLDFYFFPHVIRSVRFYYEIAKRDADDAYWSQEESLTENKAISRLRHQQYFISSLSYYRTHHIIVYTFYVATRDACTLY